MIAYILEGTTPVGAAEDPRMRRLLSTGPWQYQAHPEGSFTTWKTPDGRPVSAMSFSSPRKTSDGLTYLGPVALPLPNVLLRPNMMQNPNLTDVIVSQDTGDTIRIMPSYMTPRQILDDNTVGEPSTIYGRAVRSLLDKGKANPGVRVMDVVEEVTECCRLAVMYTYRVTRELLQDLGWLNEDSIMAIWEATIQVPKGLQKPENGS